VPDKIYKASVGIIAVFLIFLAVSLYSDYSKKQAVLNKEKAQSLSLYNEALVLLNKEDFANAKKKLYQIAFMEYRYPDKKPSLYNGAIELKSQIEDYQDRVSKGLIKSMLRDMTDEDYEKLCNKKLETIYLQPKPLNDNLMQLLYAARINRNSYIAEEKARIKEEERLKAESARRAERQARLDEQKQKYEEEQAGVTIRKAYEQLLRNKYLDAGLDIHVQVTGRNNTRLILTFPLFNDVWFRKCETAGNFNEWHSVGFNRIDLTDGYDYNRYVYW
jgi:hypothetical protein